MIESGSIAVIGAGVAGLAAALKLVEAGCRVTVLEANDRVGGRLRTVQTGDGHTVELGAEFIHGKPPDLLQLVRELGLNSTERTGEMVYYDGDGNLYPAAEDDGDDGALPVVERVRQWSEAHPEEDMSFTAWVEMQKIPTHEAEPAKQYVEGFNAADANEISVRSLAVQQAAEDEAHGDTNSAVDGGYTLFAERLAARVRDAGATIRLRAHVVALEWRPGNVSVLLADGEQVQVECAVLTLPLGVLQSGSVRFSPEPGTVLQHAARMSMGHVCRMSLVFRRRWWAELDSLHREPLERMSFLIPSERTATERPRFKVFWTPLPSAAPVLTAWSGGPEAQRFASLDDHAIAHVACADLARIFGLGKEAVLDELVSHHHHDWTRDPLACGAYSWVRAGGSDASEAMCVPVEGTLYFAGEHTDTSGNWGTVHGALRSGVRAAQQLLVAKSAAYPENGADDK